MSEQSHFTRCPHCETVFKVSQRHLEIARGKVRCGACLQVFSAIEHFVRPAEDELGFSQPSAVNNADSNDSADVEKQVSTSENSNATIAVESEDDEFLTDDRSISGANESAVDTFVQEESPEQEEKFAESENGLRDDDIIPESSTDNDRYEERQEEQEFSLNIEAVENTIEPSEVSSETDALETDYSFEMSIDSEEAKNEFSDNEDDASIDNQADADDFDELSVDETDFDVDSGAEYYEEETYSIKEDLADDLSLQIQEAGMEPDPLDEFDELVEEKSRWPKIVMALSVFAILFFGSSIYLWTQRVQLAYDHPLSPVVQSMCSLLPCQLPERVDLQAIKMTRRQVTPDSETEDQLDIRLILVNEASFEQAFPEIEMTFENIRGETIATRLFKPEDYLPADRKIRKMPINAEVHIHFSTANPASEILSYRFEFR